MTSSKAKIKVAEIFYSLQGEGVYTGVPSVFLRTFGCNFQCQGFGMPAGELSKEREHIDPKKYKSYNDLPLVHTGCDSYASWDVRFKHLSPVLTTDAIAKAVTGLLPTKKWNGEHLIITGGEPLLGWQRSYVELLEDPLMKDLEDITFETNGTQIVQDYLGDNLYRRVTFSVSPKLPNSGHSWEEAIKPEIVSLYQQFGQVYLKFVVANSHDVEYAEQAVAEYRAAGFVGPVYLMAVGGTSQLYDFNAKTVAELALKKGYRYSPRMQVDLWKNAWGT